MGARGGDRFALAVISLALDEGDASAVLAVASRFAGVAMSVVLAPCCEITALLGLQELAESGLDVSDVQVPF